MEIKIVNDLVFKAVFGQTKNKQLLIYLINALLDYKKENEIIDIEILNPFGDKDFITDKQIILDIKARDNKGELYNIEVQIDPPSNYLLRAYYYMTKLFSSQLSKGEHYLTLKKTISISILENKILFPNVKKIHTKFRMKELDDGFELSDILEMHIIELSKFDKTKPKELQTRFEKWLYFLKFGDLISKEPEVPEELKKEEGIEMAIDEYKAVTRAKRFRQYYADREQWEMDQLWKMDDLKQRAMAEGIEKGIQQGIEKGIQQGIQQGIEKGKDEARKETAKKLKDLGLPYEQIASATGLSVKEIEKL